MRALQYRSYGGPEVLEVAEVARTARRARTDPDRRQGREREPVRLEAAVRDDGRRQAAGGPGLPRPGRVRRGRRGRRGRHRGGGGRRRLRQRAATPRRSSPCWTPGRAKAPQVDWAVAAAVGVAGETSERVLRLLDVKAGDTLFIDGGAGGVGCGARAQFAVARGVRVIASASQDNQDYLREIGAIPVLYGQGVVGPGSRGERRPGRRGPGRGRQDADRGPGRAGRPSPARSSRSPTSARRVPGPG